MLLLTLSHVRPGMRLAKDIWLSNGILLLGRGQTLKESHIRRFKELGILALYVEDRRTEDIDVVDPISPETRARAVQEVAKAFNAAAAMIKEGKRVNMDVKAIEFVAREIIEDLSSNNQAYLSIIDLRTYDDYTFSHSVNTCVIGSAIAMELGIQESRLRHLAIGLLLHDIGKITVDQSIINKPGPLTQEEFEMIKAHPRKGFEILMWQEEISAKSKIIALHHHERMDGSGYPVGLKGEEIHEFGRIAAIADVYDAMTAQRIYRKSYSIQETVEFLREAGNQLFDRRYLEVFLRKVSIYPIGTVVELSTGDKAVVVAVNPDFPERPKVRVLWDRKGREVEPLELDLSKERGIEIL
jgi:HD-GYP domain-containing protein (c-di-GMP phosphodiesterase class II)